MNTDDINRYFDISEINVTDKLDSLPNAVRDNTNAGMNIFLTAESGAAVCQIIRQYAGSTPDLTITATALTEHSLNIVHCNLAKKLITTSCSHMYPNPGPSKIISRAYQENRVEIEEWSLYTHQQILMAGALGVGFMPTKSILGSSMAEENADSFVQIRDPFNKKREIGLVKAVNPDIGFVHAWAADKSGNAILSPISPQVSTDHSNWGVKACKNGVIITAEHIVSTDFIRKYSSLVSIHGYLVKAVCHTPFGAHPQGMFRPIPGVFESYSPDYDFVIQHRTAARNSDTLNEWLNKWVHECNNHEEYIKKLGNKKIKLLQEKAEGDYWKKTQSSTQSQKRSEEKPNSIEIMITIAARLIIKKILKKQHKILLGGVGVSMLSSWLAFYLLRKHGYHIDLVVGSGTYGFTPRPGDAFYGSFSHLQTCTSLSDTTNIYGYHIAGQNSRSLSVLGAAQLDKYGNVNSTRTKKGYLIGSGGANDAANANDVFIVAKQSVQKFLDKVPYITGSGKNANTIISDLGVFKKSERNSEFELSECLPGLEELPLDQRIIKIKENCGWNLKVAEVIVEQPMPTVEELSLVRSLDPEAMVIGG